MKRPLILNWDVGFYAKRLCVDEEGVKVRIEVLTHVRGEVTKSIMLIDEEQVDQLRRWLEAWTRVRRKDAPKAKQEKLL